MNFSTVISNNGAAVLLSVTKEKELKVKHLDRFPGIKIELNFLKVYFSFLCCGSVCFNDLK